MFSLAAFTVIPDVAVLFPSLVVTAIVAAPEATAVTKPLALTVAIEVLLKMNAVLQHASILPPAISADEKLLK